MQDLVIVGGGFAGFWSAMSAAAQARKLGKSNQLRITLISKDAFHTIRPALYQADLDELRFPLVDYCAPLNIRLVVNEVTSVDPRGNSLRLGNNGEQLPYDYLILAAGSRLRHAAIPGAEKIFNVDTYDAAQSLQNHLEALARRGFTSMSSRTVVVVGGGLTGMEIAANMPRRLRQLAGNDSEFNCHLIESGGLLGGTYSEAARQYINDRLRSLGITVHLHTRVQSQRGDTLVLDSGATLATETVIWTAGLEATPLTQGFNAVTDAQGRLSVDEFLGLKGYDNVFVAGDAAQAKVDADHYALMSCQHAMPQGKVAGHNCVNKMSGLEMTPYSQPRYATCVDLGSDNALFTLGWERNIEKTGVDARQLKTQILTQWICPPKTVEETLRMAGIDTR